MLIPTAIRAITLDLDDTLWPVLPTLLRAEETLAAWLASQAPATASHLATPAAPHLYRRQFDATQ